MTARRQFCPRGHDTFVVGRDSSYRCKACKRESSNEARWAREAEAQAARHVELEARQAEAARRRKRERARILKAGGPAAKELLLHEAFSRSKRGLCQWAQENGHPGACMRPAQNVYCAKHNRVVDERNESEPEPEPEPELEEKPKPDPGPRDFWIVA
jgi:hypothetical protein